MSIQPPATNEIAALLSAFFRGGGVAKAVRGLISRDITLPSYNTLHKVKNIYKIGVKLHMKDP